MSFAGDHAAYYGDPNSQQQQQSDQYYDPNAAYAATDQQQQQYYDPNAAAYDQMQQNFGQMNVGGDGYGVADPSSYGADPSQQQQQQQQQDYYNQQYGQLPAAEQYTYQQQQQQAPPPQPQLQQPSMMMMSSRPVIPEGVKLCDPRHLSLTTHALPSSKQLLESCKLPLGVVAQPLAPTGGGGEDIPVVNFGSVGVIRCVDCRAYMNPYVHWLDGGQSWRCNFCTRHNDTGSAYFCATDQQGYRQDMFQRAELCYSTYDIIAPSEYMMRAPMPPVYVFLIDVSYQAVQSGMLHMLAYAVKSALDALPGGGRQRVAFMTFDSSVHFYSLRCSANGPQMYVMADLEDVTLPAPMDLLVNVEESRTQVDAFLDALPEMFATSVNVESAFGPALDGALKLMQELGGRLMCFLSGLPSLGMGRLKNREDPRVLGTPKEHLLLQPASDLYTRKAIQFTRYQISVDTFVFAHDYTDTATISCLSQYTGGQSHFYPNFQHAVDGERFVMNLHRSLTQECGWEAVVRIRCANAMKLENFRGNFFVRGADLLALPSVSSTAAMTADMSFKDTQLTSNAFSVQAALLYTSSGGERRIRVSTLCVPVVSTAAEVYAAASAPAITAIVAKQAVDDAIFHGFVQARDRIRLSCTNMLRAQYHHTTSRGQPLEHDALSSMPLSTLGMLKCAAFRDGNETRSDERSYYLSLVRAMGSGTLESFFRPRMFALHEMADSSDGLWDTETNTFVNMPAELSLTAANLTPESLVLIDNGLMFFLRCGSQYAGSGDDVFEYSSDNQKMVLRTSEDDKSVVTRIRNILDFLRGQSMIYQGLTIVKEDDPMEALVYQLMIEDRTVSSLSLNEFVSQIYQQHTTTGY